ncbi:MAG: hypothetical protein GSR85_03090 [Desulfurococcales archaeon]|nr:hypothetical protein [Desulfurococcales archaeon]
MKEHINKNTSFFLELLLIVIAIFLLVILGISITYVNVQGEPIIITAKVNSKEEKVVRVGLLDLKPKSGLGINVTIKVNVEGGPIDIVILDKRSYEESTTSLHTQYLALKRNVTSNVTITISTELGQLYDGIYIILSGTDSANSNVLMEISSSWIERAYKYPFNSIVSRVAIISTVLILVFFAALIRSRK